MKVKHINGMTFKTIAITFNNGKIVFAEIGVPGTLEERMRVFTPEEVEIITSL